MRRYPRQVQNGWTEINETYEAVTTGSALMIGQALEILGNPHHQRNMQTTLVGVTLSTGQNPSVIPKIKNESILKESVLLELTDNRSNLLIYHLHAVQVTGMSVTESRRIREIRGQLDFGWVMDGLLSLHYASRKVEGAFM